jgi:hypothetical protein
MTKISEYPVISNPTEEDILIGTDKSGSDETKNFSIGSIVNLVENGGRPYKSYSALLTQSGTSAPTAIVLENTLGGGLIWSYTNEGYYTATLVEGFSIGNTFATANSSPLGAASFNLDLGLTSDTNELYSYNFSNVLSNSILAKTPVEIRVYN